MYRKIYYIGFAGYITLFIFSILFYKERISFLDGAYFLFHILKAKSFAIFHYRYIAVVTEVYPVVAAKLNLSLEAATRLYSIGFIANYFLCYLICGLVLKKYDFALIILLSNILIMRDTFYWPVSELPQALILVSLFFAVLQNISAGNLSGKFFVIIGSALIAFSHPLICFPFTYCILFFYLKRNKTIKQELLRLSFVLFIAVFILKAIFLRDKYDTSAMSGMRNFLTLFPNYFIIASNIHFLQACLYKYYWLAISFIAVVVLYAKAKQWFILLHFLIFFIGYLLLINISHPQIAATPDFYYENLYLPLCLFVAFPLIFDLLPRISKTNIVVLIFSLVILSSCIRVYNTHKKYTARLHWYRKKLAELGNTKSLLNKTSMPLDTITMGWATAYEFWLLSTLETGRTASIVYMDANEIPYWALGTRNGFVTNWGVFSYKEFRTPYFVFSDSLSAYTIKKD